MRNKHTEKIMDIIHTRGLLYPLDVVLVGATGVGKSSTINALFGDDVAKVGAGVDPETMHISQYKVSNALRFSDTAGLGDGQYADREHSKNLSSCLLDSCVEQGTSFKYGRMDLVLVILDGSSRDMGTTYKLLEQVVLKSMEPSRVIVALNQCDMAMKGRGWDQKSNSPNSELLNFLEDKSSSIQQRLKESTGLSVSKPVYYSAYHGYNLDKLMQHIINHMPHGRRRI